MVGYSTSVLIAALAVVGAQAHIGQGCGGHGVMKRNEGGPLKTYVPRAAPTDEASAAQSVDPAEECTPYSYQKVLDIKSSFPPIWETAKLLPSDTEAQQILAGIKTTLQQKVPNDKPKGTAAGDFSGANYTAADPDCWWTWRQCTTPSDTSIPADIVTVPEPNTWGLGFDDGPNCSHNALYDLLRDNNQKATMFYIGSNVMNWPLQAMRALEDGHEICIHTWSHQYMTSFDDETAFAELYYTRKAIKEILGVTPKCWRPPFGDIDNRIRLIAQGLNLTSILWNQDTEDWRINTNGVTAADIDENYEAYIAQGKNGTWSEHGPVILNHELNNFTMSEMVKYYSQIKSAYKAVVPIQAAYNITQPYVESNYTYADFQKYVGGNTNMTTSTGTSASSTASSTTSGAAASNAPSAAPSGSGGASAIAQNAAASQAPKSAAGRTEVGAGLAVLAGLFGAAMVL